MNDYAREELAYEILLKHIEFDNSLLNIVIGLITLEL